MMGTELPIRIIDIDGVQVKIWTINNRQRAELAPYLAVSAKENLSPEDHMKMTTGLVKMVYMCLKPGIPELTEEIIWKWDLFAGRGSVIRKAVQEVVDGSFLAK